MKGKNCHPPECGTKLEKWAHITKVMWISEDMQCTHRTLCTRYHRIFAGKLSGAVTCILALLLAHSNKAATKE